MKKSMKLVLVISLAAVAMGVNAADNIYNGSNTYAITVQAYNEFSKIGDSRTLNGGIRRNVKGLQADEDILYMPKASGSGSYAVNFFVIDSKPSGRYILVQANNPYYFKAPSSLSKKSFEKITGKMLKDAASEAKNKINVTYAQGCESGEGCVFAVEVGVSMNNNIAITEIPKP
jgi:hypothetical protein